ncbi:MAG TPA: hypothetical protein VF521_03355, partial [Pyrinomonadaceae bacterium]
VDDALRVGHHLGLEGEAAVLFCFLRTPLAFLWYNVVGAAVVVLSALVFNLFMKRNRGRARGTMN